MTLKKIGEKLKNSLHHKLPHSKRGPDAGEPCCEGAAPAAADCCPQGSPACCAKAPSGECCAKAPSGECCAKAPECCAKAPSGECCGKAPSGECCAQGPSADCCAQEPCCVQRQPSPTSARGATPTWEREAEILPTMFYLVHAEEAAPISQSVLLVNPSKSDKEFHLRVWGDCAATLDREQVPIRGDLVERVTIKFTPEDCGQNVYVDLLHEGRLYDRIRVQAKLS